MTRTDNPIEGLAAALHAACLRDLPDIAYRDRDWEKHRERMNAMPPDQRRAFYEKEKQSGQAEGDYIEKARRPTPHDVGVSAMFPQMWSSTALGFGGIGGAAMTTAYTIIIESPHTGHFAVYFGNSGRLAYLVQANTPMEFFEDIKNRNMASCKEASQRYGVIWS